MGTLATWFVGLLVVNLGMTAVWAASVRRVDVSLVDRFWGPAFAVLATTYAVVGDGDGTRTAIVLVLVWLWAARLGGYITWRNWGEDEDKRYVAMREKHGEGWETTSLVRVFLLQGTLAWLISVPLLGALTDPEPAAMTVLDGLGILVWVVGIVFEAGGDWQLQRFLADPANRGKVMNRGLWRYTRHPNYFGDIVVWVAFGLFGLAAGAWWGLVGPAVMYWFIVNISGVALTDKNMGESSSKREGYDDYVARTNAFFPGPPSQA